MSTSNPSQKSKVLVIGAGPAGLTAAYKLAGEGFDVVVLESDERYVGGISRTVDYKGFKIDIGGHRFFSKSKEVEELWSEILPDGFLTRRRSSKIYYRKKFFSYPLRPLEALFRLGPVESVRCILSYCRAAFSKTETSVSYEDWVSSRFGRRLYSIFFKTYTEKVWGMDCRDISADWAAQRIGALSLGAALMRAMIPKAVLARTRYAQNIKSLIQTFRYPRMGPGMFWEATAKRVQALGGQILMGHKVVGLENPSRGGQWLVQVADAGATKTISCDHVISSTSMRTLVRALGLPEDSAAADSARRLQYRDFIMVALIIKDKAAFLDNWIYIHDPNVKVGRIQNFKAWSPEMVPDPDLCCLGMEYFCAKKDSLWDASDDDLIRLAKSELEALGFAQQNEVLDGLVIRQPKAYPVYDSDYLDKVNVVRTELEARFPNLHLVGRNGLHKYNNQDHSMMSAIYAAKNIALGQRTFDAWSINVDADYLESRSAGSEGVTGMRHIPTAL